MKKLLGFLSITILICCGLLVYNKDEIQAQASTRTNLSISEETIITEDTEYSYIDFSYTTEDFSETCFKITNGATLVINDCTFNNTTIGSGISSIFVVEDNSKLILNNVNLTNAKYINSGIINRGNVEISNVIFATGGISISSSSEKENPIVLLSGSIGKVNLQKGYISLTKDSVVTGTTQITLTGSSDVNTLVVRGVGENVFAGRYLKNFACSLSGATNGCVKVLDYVGDHTGTIKDVTGKITLNSGDIIITEYSEELFDLETLISDAADVARLRIDMPASYCTANSMLQQDYFFTNTGTGPDFDNFSANTTASRLKWSQITDYVTATIKVIKEDVETPVSSNTETFFSGSNHAIFIDIPEGYEFESATCYLGLQKNDTIIKVSDNKFSNGVYMRPILEYIPTDIASYEVNVEFVFKKAENLGTISITKDAGIEVNYDNKLVVGNKTVFTIPFTDNALIKGVTFNGEKVELVETQDSYTFEVEIEESNSLVINSISLPINIEIEPNPTKTIFQYGEEIILSEEYTVAETEDTITIYYTADSSNNVGTHYINIDSVTCTSTKYNSSIYNITIADGNYPYTITAEEIDLLNIIELKENVKFDYSKNLKQTLTVDMFIKSIPSYLNASINLDNLNINELNETIEIIFTLKDNNLSFKDNVSSLIVSFSINPIELEILPSLSKTTFEYDESIVLTQQYTVTETDDIITIVYTPDADKSIGTHAINLSDILITSTNFENSFYNITFVDGKYSYTITTKQIVLTDVITLKNNVSINYSKDLKQNINVSMFIESIPSYLDASLNINNLDINELNETIQIVFTLKSANYSFKDDIDTLNVSLTINPVEIDDEEFEDCVFDGEIEYVYNSTQNVIKNVIGYDSDIVKVEYTLYKINNQTKEVVDFAKDSGTYEIVATMTSKHLFYTLDYTMSQTFVIKKAIIDLTTYINSIESYTPIVYNGQSHILDIKVNSVPNGARVDTVENNIGFINAGTYTITINFAYDSNNYTCIDSYDVDFVISPKAVSKIALVQKTFNYTGTKPTLSAIATGLIGDDICNVILSTDIKINAETHYIAVTGLSNPNYTFNQETTLEYKINTITPSLDITYGLDPVEYDGKEHLPILAGTLPEGITYKIDKNVDLVNAGTHSVKCTFYSSNPNYTAPSPIYTIVTINKRPVYVEFSEPSNMIANGLEKSIEIRFNNVLANEDLVYEANYSQTPILAGEYNLIVNVPNNSNYYIANNQTYTFTIFAGSMFIREEGIDIQVDGKFANGHAVQVSKVENENVSKAFETSNIKGYTTLDISYISYSTEPVKVSIKADGLVSDTRYLKLYKLEGQDLKEIEYSLDGDVISFTLSSNSQIVFAEGNTKAYTYRTAIITICSLAFISLFGYFAIIIEYVKQGNPYRTLNKKKK